MLLRRALVFFTLGPLTLLLIYLGGWLYFLAFVALLSVATFEYAQLIRRLGWRSPLWLLLPAVALLWFLPLPVQSLLFKQGGLAKDFTEPWLLVSLLASLCYALWLYERHPQENAIAAWFATTSGIVLLGWVGSHFFRIRGGLPLESAAAWTALAMLSIWIADSAAYVVGKTLGRRKLSPRSSPNKTIEGYVGGIFWGTVFTVLIALVLDLPWFIALILGLLITILSPAGDLGVSLLKREAKVKDSGHLLPGHGGALDRIDSLMWAVAITYYLVLLTG